MTPETESSNQLSPEAVQRLVDSHRQFLSFLEKRVESRAVAEDILQSAFVRGLERGGGLRDEESIVAWFYRVLRNAIIDHYRHRASTERANEGWGKEFITQRTPSAGVQEEICQCVSALAETLKPEYRDALRIIDIDEGTFIVHGDVASRRRVSADDRLRARRIVGAVELCEHRSIDE